MIEQASLPAPLVEILDRLVERVTEQEPASFRDLAEAAGLDPAHDFIGAPLQDIDFRDEDLRGFDFSMADLTGADFRRANVAGVRFDGAILTGTIGLYQSHLRFEGKHEFRFQASGVMEHLVSLHLEVKCLADERQATLFGDLWAGGLRPFDSRKPRLHIGLRRVRIKLNCSGCSPMPSLGISDDDTYRQDIGSIQVSRLGSKLWEITTRSKELCLNGFIKSVPLTHITMYESEEVLIEATLCAYPKDITLQDLSGNSRFGDVKMKLLKLVLTKAIGRDGDEIVLMQYYLHRQKIDTYNIHRHAGAIGKNAHAHDMSFQQVWNQSNIDLPRLAEELTQLRAAMKQETEGTREHDKEIVAVADAEETAINGDGPTALGHLKAAGTWALGVAEKIGVSVAAEAIKRAT
jgi:hypothetical protein